MAPHVQLYALLIAYQAACQNSYSMFNSTFEGGKAVIGAHAVNDMPSIPRQKDISNVLVPGDPLAFERTMPNEYQTFENPFPWSHAKAC